MSAQVDNKLDQPDLTAQLKGVMRQAPSGVAVVTTRLPDSDTPVGMAASSVISVTMDPPTMLVAINRSAASHAAFVASGRFCLNMLSLADSEQVGLFSSRERAAERFSGENWASQHQLDYLVRSNSIFCNIAQKFSVGTHDIFIGEVFDIIVSDQSTPLVWADGGINKLVSA